MIVVPQASCMESDNTQEKLDLSHYLEEFVEF